MRRRAARRARRTRSGLVAALALLVALACGDPEAAAPEPPLPAPEFELDALDGPPVALDALRGRPVIVDFWATWCAPCLQQIPVLNAVHAAHAEVEVLGISVDTDGPEAVRAFAHEHGIAYRVLLGDTALARRFGVPGFPALFVLDGQGRIRTSHVGVASEEMLEEALEELSEGA